MPLPYFLQAVRGALTHLHHTEVFVRATLKLHVGRLIMSHQIVAFLKRRQVVGSATESHLEPRFKYQQPARPCVG